MASTTRQDARRRAAIEARAVDYEARYRELQDAARGVLLEAERLNASPDASAFVALGVPWLPVEPLRVAIERFQTAQRELLPGAAVTVRGGIAPQSEKG